MVKCADCGFLTMRNKYTGSLEEVDAVFRAAGNTVRRRTFHTDSTGRERETQLTPFQHVPICFARASDLVFEAGLSPEELREGEGVRPAKVLEIINKERNCSAFEEWRQGFSPKEHQEALNGEAARDYERRRDLAIRDREDARDRRAEEWQGEQLETLRSQHTEEMKTLRNQHRWQLFVFGGLIGAATIAAGILDGLVSRGVDLWPL